MPTKEYPREEMELRWQRAHAQMDREGLDALVVTERGNFWWLTGVRISNQFYNKMRPTIAILPKGRPPTLIVYSLEQRQIADASWAPDVRSFVDAPFPPEVAVDALKDLGLAEGNIGLELGASQRMWFSVGHLEAVRDGLPSARFVDGSNAMEHLRLHKTALEVHKIRDAIDTAQNGLDRLTPELKVGMTAREVTARLTILMIEEGADLRNPGGIGGDFQGLPDDYQFVPGDVKRFDFGAVRAGYWSDICRRVVFQENDHARRHQDVLWRMMTRCIEALGPGVPVARIHDIHNQELARAGYPPLPPGKRVGHGLGIDPSEPPSLSAAEDTILEPGMVVTIEPRFDADYGLAHLEEDLLITENGYEWLSGGQSQELKVVG
jgi:Xaa-Pro aminopeptidase